MSLGSEPITKRIKTESFSSESSATGLKKYGKSTRSNEIIGNLTIERANELAEELTGYHEINLLLPHRSIADYGCSNKTIATFDDNDVVIQRKLCLICLENPIDAYFKTHISQNHSDVSPETSEIMRRLSDVRYSRFCQNAYISLETAQEKFPTIHPNLLINFLAGIGFYICKSRGSIPKEVNFDKKYEEPDVRGVSKDSAYKIVERLRNSTIHFLEDLEFSAEVVRNSRMLDPSTQTTVQCHICDKISNVKNFKRHMQVHQTNWKSEVSLDDVTAIFRRITDVRNVLYYAAQPVDISKIKELAGEDVQDEFISFLLQAGYVVGGFSPSNLEHLPSKIVVSDPNTISSRSSSVKMKLENGESVDSEHGSEYESSSCGFSRSRSSSVTSDASSTSVCSTSSSQSRIVIGPCSSPSEEPFPYCVLNAIPEHIEVEQALFEILEKMTDDPDFCLSQVQYSFLLGYTMYSLVVANGSKQNVISRLTIGDFKGAEVDENSKLHTFSFSTVSTCTQSEVKEFLCADERIWRALEIFEVARERRAREMNWSTMEEDTAPFFFSYVSPLPITKDTNYFMSQFLRMCQIDWPCRSSAICSAAWSLVKKDSKKAQHLQYAITYFMLLREKEQCQLQLLDDGLAGHPTYQRISFSFGFERKSREKQPRKKQKRYTTPERKGIPNKPRGGDHKSKKFLESSGRLFAESSLSTPSTPSPPSDEADEPVSP